jgi:hypothetical protein
MVEIACNSKHTTLGKIIPLSLCSRPSRAKKQQKTKKGDRTTKSAYDFFYDDKCRELKSNDSKLSVVALGTVCEILWKVQRYRDGENQRERQSKSERERQRRDREERESEREERERESQTDRDREQRKRSG